jgi:hypothetical protein
MWWSRHEGAATAAFLIACVAGLAVDAVSTPIVRRAVEETHIRSMLLVPHGETVDIRNLEVFGTAPEGGGGAQERDMCDDDFLTGAADTNHCVGGNATVVLSEAQCIEAARKAAAEVDRPHFHIDSHWVTSHPLGCFQWPCQVSGVKHLCFFYNGGVVGGDHPHGFPVCRRAEFINGTTNAKGGNFTDSGCSEPYVVIMDETECFNMAECFSEPHRYEFRVGEHNETHRTLHPQGCFFNTEIGAVQFNPVDESYNNPPPEPVGIPVCRIHKNYRVPPLPPDLGANSTNSSQGE